MKNLRLLLAGLLIPVGIAALLVGADARADLALDTSFGTDGIAVVDVADGSDAAVDVAEQADGALVLAGTSQQTVGADSLDYVVLTRVDGATGAADGTFGTGGTVAFLPGLAAADGGGGTAQAVLIQPIDQKIVVAGTWDANEGAGSQMFVARVDASGVLDPAFGTDGVALLSPTGVTDPSATAIALRSDGSIVVVGSATQAGAGVGVVTGVTSTGTPIPGFADAIVQNPLVNEAGFRLDAVVVLAADAILAAGGGGDLTVVRLTSAGVPDAGFGTNGIISINVAAFDDADGPNTSFDRATALAVLGDGGILIAGGSGADAEFTTTNRVLARLTSAGALDTTFGSGGFAPLPDVGNTEIVEALAVRASGDIVLVGPGFTPTQLSPGGITLRVIGGSFAPVVSAVRVLSDGNVAAAGHQTVSGANTALAAVRLLATDLPNGPDTVPDPFSFATQTDLAVQTLVISNSVTISGIDAPTSVSVASGSQYSLGCEETNDFTSVAGTVNNGQLVCVRRTTASTGQTAAFATLNVGNVTGTFTTVTGGDVTPDPFSFTNQTSVPLATPITSAIVTLSGFDTRAPISVTGGTYSVGCSAGGFTATSGGISPNTPVCVRHTSAITGATVTSTVLTVGDASATFTSTTISGDASPAPFSFTNQVGVDLYEQVTSAPVAIQGTDISAPISVEGGEYSIDCTSVFTTAAGSIAPGRTVCVRHRSSFDSSSDAVTTLTVGDGSAEFTSTTRVGDQTPASFSFDTQGAVALETIIVSSPITIAGVDSPVRLFLAGPVNEVAFARDCAEPYELPDPEGAIFENGDTLCVVLFSPATELTSAVATASIGGSMTVNQMSATFTVTTGETVPDDFTFTDQVGILLNDTAYALPITITGITAPSRVEVSNGQWQLNCTGSYTASPGVASNGDTICVRHIAAGSLATITSTVLTVGGVSDTFSSTTVVDKPLPGGSALDPLSLLLLAPLLAYRRRRGMLAANPVGAPSGATD